MSEPKRPAPLVLGRYTLFEPFARGGMAAVHFGKARGDGGFSRIVAIKRLHEGLAHDPEIVAMLRDEANLSALVHHMNVAPILDVVREGDEVLLVMDYIDGESLAALAKASRTEGQPVPTDIVSAILVGVCNGLHAAHTARDPDGTPREIVHRDVSPQNVMVGSDGVVRILDFGVARARNRAQRTHTGQIKGKLRYLSPEQVHGDATPRSDVYAAGIVAWELLVGDALFRGNDNASVLASLLLSRAPRIRERREDVPPALEDAVMRSLVAEPGSRYASAAEMAQAIASAVSPAQAAQVSDWVSSLAGAEIAVRRRRVREIEATQLPPSARPDATPSGATPSGRVRPPGAPLRRWLVIALAAAAIAALGISAVYAIAWPRASHGPTVATSIAAETARQTSVAVPVPDDAAADESTAEPEGSVVPAGVRPPPKRRRSPRTRNCPPFVFDDAGHKHFVVHCL